MADGAWQKVNGPMALPTAAKVGRASQAIDRPVALAETRPRRAAYPVRANRPDQIAKLVECDSIILTADDVPRVSPCEHLSPVTMRRSGITKMGKALARRVLTEGNRTATIGALVFRGRSRPGRFRGSRIRVVRLFPSCPLAEPCKAVTNPPRSCGSGHSSAW